MNNISVLLTGGAGFIGSELSRWIIRNTKVDLTVLDDLTYAGNLKSLDSISKSPRFTFIKNNICNVSAVEEAIKKTQPDVVFHLAAESHVDNSIQGPRVFIETNIMGTFTLLESAREYWNQLDSERKSDFRFIHVSTDEVFGSLKEDGYFTEETAYDPSSPYSASKAASDHLARAWHRTYNIPVIVTNCSNNYGPYQYPEKLIPLMIINALHEKELPVYGKGSNVRDWLHVEDHAAGLWAAFTKGLPGSSYNFGGKSEKSNLSVVETICDILDEIAPVAKSRRDLIRFVKDRPGHDFRYAIKPDKAEKELSWQPNLSFEEGLRQTIQWYLDNDNWWKAIINKKKTESN